MLSLHGDCAPEMVFGDRRQALRDSACREVDDALDFVRVELERSLEVRNGFFGPSKRVQNCRQSNMRAPRPGFQVDGLAHRCLCVGRGAAIPAAPSRGAERSRGFREAQGLASRSAVSPSLDRPHASNVHAFAKVSAPSPGDSTSARLTASSDCAKRPSSTSACVTVITSVAPSAGASGRTAAREAWLADRSVDSARFALPKRHRNSDTRLNPFLVTTSRHSRPSRPASCRFRDTATK